MGRINIENWQKYGFEFLSIFIAVIAAFALNNWNENRKAEIAESRILTEITNGLEKDLEDLRANKLGHEWGISACNYFRELVMGKVKNPDSIKRKLFLLTRDFISIQNIAGYETLKSRGLELIQNDTLRLQIISLYEYDYSTLRKLEEEYAEMQFHTSYFENINKILTPSIHFNTDGNIIGIDSPLKISEDQKKTLLHYLWRIQLNRTFILDSYSEIESKIVMVHDNLKKIKK